MSIHCCCNKLNIAQVFELGLIVDDIRTFCRIMLLCVIGGWGGGWGAPSMHSGFWRQHRPVVSCREVATSCKMQLTYHTYEKPNIFIVTQPVVRSTVTMLIHCRLNIVNVAAFYQPIVLRWLMRPMHDIFNVLRHLLNWCSCYLHYNDVLSIQKFHYSTLMLACYNSGHIEDL